jgi:ribosomal protein S27AE
VQPKPTPCRKCGSPDVVAKQASRSDYRCRLCTNADSAAWYAGRPAGTQRSAKSVAWRQETGAARFKRDWADPIKREIHRVRSYTRRQIRQGLLIRHPCEVCGAENVQAHHDDYAKPLAVRWLCVPHHRRVHMELRRAGLAPLPPLVGQAMPATRNPNIHQQQEV